MPGAGCIRTFCTPRDSCGSPLFLALAMPAEPDIDGCEVVTGARQPRPLTPAGTVFARYVVGEEDGDEERFVERVAVALEALSVTARKQLCRRSHRIESAQTASASLLGS